MSLTKVPNSMIDGYVVSPDSYGADPTGILDSTSAIQSAFDSGKSVSFTSGSEYKISGNLTLSGNNQLIQLNGSSLLFQRTALTIEGTDIVFDLGGGTLSQECGYATVAVETVAGSNTIIVDDASTLRVGQLMCSSWGDSSNGEDPLTLPPPFNTLDARISSIVGNTVTLDKNMLGSTCTLPVGLVVGEFSWTSFIYTHGTRVLIKDGTIKRSVGFYTYVTEADASDYGSTTFENVYFESNALDQFSLEKKHTLTFNNCKVNQQWDAAKQGFVFKSDGRVYISDCDMALANHDSAFLFINQSYDQSGYSRLVVKDSTISGLARIAGPIAAGKGSWAGDAQVVVQDTDPGTVEKIIFDNCDVLNYVRHFLSGTTISRSENVVISEIRIDNCSIDCSFSYYLFDGASAGFNCPNCNISNTSFYQSEDGQIFNYVEGINGATISFEPVFDNCYFKLTGNSSKFSTKAIVRNSTFSATPYKHSSGVVEMQNCLFKNGSTIEFSPAYSAEFFGDIESILVDHSDFPSNPSGFFIGTGFRDGSKIANARSVDGQTYYNVYAKGTSVLVSGIFYKSNGVYFLRGDDWYIPIGSQIIDMYLGTTQKVTFNLATTLASNASASATSIVVTDATGVAVGDLVNIYEDNTLVDTKVVDAAYGGGTTIPLTTGLDSAAASGNSVNFFRVV